MTGRADILYYKGEPELERNICRIIPELKFDHVGFVPEAYAVTNGLAHYVFCADLFRGGMFLTEKGKQWIRDRAPKPQEQVISGQIKCAYCRTPRMSMHKECKGCGASEVMA